MTSAFSIAAIQTGLRRAYVNPLTHFNVSKFVDTRWASAKHAFAPFHSSLDFYLCAQSVLYIQRVKPTFLIAHALA
jgi:hypothetical protein